MAFGFVALGASLGGLRALQQVLGGLPADFCAPIGVVLHRHKEALELADILGRATPLPTSCWPKRSKIGSRNRRTCGNAGKSWKRWFALGIPRRQTP